MDSTRKSIVSYGFSPSKFFVEKNKSFEIGHALGEAVCSFIHGYSVPFAVNLNFILSPKAPFSNLSPLDYPYRVAITTTLWPCRRWRNHCVGHCRYGIRSMTMSHLYNYKPLRDHLFTQMTRCFVWYLRVIAVFSSVFLRSASLRFFLGA